MSRLRALTLCILALALPALAYKHGGPATFTMQPLDIGGGGFVRGISISADGTKVVRTDTYGAYWWNGAKWVQLVSSTSLPNGDPMNSPTACLNAAASCGVYEIQVAPSNTNIAYMMLNGYTYKTSNLKSAPNETWTATVFPQCTGCGSNQNDNAAGPHIAIDPANAASVVEGQPGGLYYSSNSGTSVSGPVGGITTPTVGAGQEMLVLFDPSTTTGGSTPGLYAASNGAGVYHTGTGPGGTWTLTSGTPTANLFMTIGPDGELYFVPLSASSQVLELYNGSAWSSQTLPSGGAALVGIAIDPAHSTFASNAFLSAINAGGQVSYTTNSGGTWSNPATTTRACSGDVGWLCNTNETYMTAGQIVYDPTGSNELYFSEGIGVWEGNPSTASTITWNAQTRGIEQLVSNSSTSPPGGNPILSFWDRPVFTVINPSSYPTQHGLSYTYSIILSNSADYAKSNPATVFANADWFGNETSGVSSNGGGSDGGPSNWTLCASYPSVASPNQYTGAFVNGGNGWAGSVAASTPTNFMWGLSDDAGLFYTTDGCTTWNLALPTGVAAPPAAQGWGHAYFNNRGMLCADADSGVFYAYNGGADLGSTSTAGFYKFTSGGSVSSRTYTGNIDAFDGYNATMRCVPGVAGEFYWSSGEQTPGPYPHSISLYDCTDSAPGTTGGTINCAAFSGVQEVASYGFGKAKAGGSGYPSIYIVGWVSGVYGLYRSDNHGSTWTLLSSAPCGSLDTPRTVSGDMNTWDTVYVGWAGSSFCIGMLN